MGLIKSTHAPSTLSPFSMTDIETAARGTLRRAGRQAEQIIAAAQTEAEILKAQARTMGQAEGRQEGRVAGIEEGRKSGHAQALAEHGPAMAKAMEALLAAAKAFDRERDDLETVGLTGVIDLACAIARRVSKRQGMLEPRVLIDNLKEAMALVVHSADLRIAVHPSQRKTLEAELPNLRLAWPRLKHIELVEDAGISPGGARLHTAGGLVDADLDAQLDTVIAQLMPDSLAAELR